MISSPFSSRAPLPTISQDADDDDITDEILIFDEDEEDDKDRQTPGSLMVEEDDEDYDYSLGVDENMPQGYSRKELEGYVAFVRSSKDVTTGNFHVKQKTLLWCLQTGCEEARPGVWSGFWYFTYLHGEAGGRRAWMESKNKRLVRESGGRARQVPCDDYRRMLACKEKGKRAFHRGQYKTALDCFIKAEELMGGDVSGIFLVPFQRADMVTVLSNQAECCLRLKKYEHAIVQTTKALQLDRRHRKSLLRRAKARVSLRDAAASTAVDDLQILIDMKGAGAEEAQELLHIISSIPPGLHTSLSPFPRTVSPSMS